MLDLINQETNATDAAIRRGDEIYSIHNNPADVGLFSKFAKVERVPIEAGCPAAWNDFDIVTNRPVEGYSALYNRATDALLDVRPVSRHYALIPHDSLFEKQAALLAESDLPDDNVTVTDRIYGYGKRVHRTVVFHELLFGIRRGEIVPPAEDTQGPHFRRCYDLESRVRSRYVDE